ncbi:4201_t:CDS:2 [Gigaspora rosea]|nr:4201_t:CDS:2 [Gigaspora rosea]
MQQQIPEHILQPTPRVNQNVPQQTFLLPISLSISQHVAKCGDMARAKNNCTKHATAKECLQTQNTSSQQKQRPQKIEHYQQISTNPNMIPSPQTPNILDAQFNDK